MNPLHFDDVTCAHLATHRAAHPDAALRLELVSTYSRGGPYSALVLRWTTVARAERNSQLLRWTGPHAVPVFIAPRLWRYMLWHPLGVHGVRVGPFTRLVPDVDPLFVATLQRWERQHPLMGLPSVAVA